MNKFRRGLGRVYALAFVAELSYRWGWSHATWIKRGALVGLAATLLSGRLWLVLVVGGLVCLLYGLFTLAKRSGYITFLPLTDRPLAVPDQPLKKEQRLRIRATGIFSLADRERYLVQKQGHIWRVGLGDHVLMIENGVNSYLYQFIKPQEVLQLSAGHLFFGTEAFTAVEVVFHTDWAPSIRTEDIGYYVGSGYGNQPLPRRTIYITFEDERQLALVWHSLTQQ